MEYLNRTIDRFRALLPATLILFAATTAQAVSVSPGATVPLSGTTSAAEPDLAGLVIRDALIPFSVEDSLGGTILTGVLQDRVVRSDNTGKLIFAPRIRDTAGVDSWITGLRIVGYDGFATDVDFRTDGLGDEGPYQVTRSADGDELFFNYGVTLIEPPEESLFNSVVTDATTYGLTGRTTIFVQNDFGADVYSTTLLDTAAPALVPLPAAFWLFGGGLLGLSAIARRRTLNR